MTVMMMVVMVVVMPAIKVALVNLVVREWSSKGVSGEAGIKFWLHQTRRTPSTPIATNVKPTIAPPHLVIAGTSSLNLSLSNCVGGAPRQKDEIRREDEGTGKRTNG